MSHDESGAPDHRRFHRLHDFLLGFWVDGRRRVVEQEDGRLEQQRAGDGDALALAAGEVDAAFAEEGLVAFAGLLQQFSAQVTTLASVVDNAQVSLAGAKRIFEILDTDPGVATEPGAASPGRFLGRVAFDNVSFEYQENATVLHELSFVAEPGQRIAIAGATGAGKSALLSLIPRFYDPRSGRVTLDGHDIRALPLPELRRQVGMVFQENFLFSNTIAANIAFGHPEATQERIERAARIAGAHAFI
ncbi:MAG: hypothetical protein RL309_998, partial [Verrucomicrobiota bacterium]